MRRLPGHTLRWCGSFRSRNLAAMATPSIARAHLPAPISFSRTWWVTISTSALRRSPPLNALVELAGKERCSVSGVQPTRESVLSRYGTVGGRRVPPRSDLYRVDTVIEKPTPTEAGSSGPASFPALRAGHYLCFFGIHVLTPTVMDILSRTLVDSSDKTVILADALAELARREQYLAVEDKGRVMISVRPMGRRLLSSRWR